jgi:hypothetical protein
MLIWKTFWPSSTLSGKEMRKRLDSPPCWRIICPTKNKPGEISAIHFPESRRSVRGGKWAEENSAPASHTGTVALAGM